MAGILDILDAVLPSQVSTWLSSLFTYKKFFRSAKELSYNDFWRTISMCSNLKLNLLDLIQTNDLKYILVITVPDGNKFVKGQIIGLNDRYRALFTISDENINRIKFPKSENGNYKISYKIDKK